MRPRLFVLLVFAGSALPAQKPAVFEITLDPGGRAFGPSLQVVTLAPKTLGVEGDLLARLEDAQGRPIGGVQTNRLGGAAGLRVSWVQDRLDTEVRLRLTLAPNAEGTPVAATSFAFKGGDGYRDLVFGERPVLRHVNRWDPAEFDRTYKHFHHVFGVHGEGFLTKGPGGRFTHHRGLFSGWRVKRGDQKWDFWHCRGKATVRHEKYDTRRELVGPCVARTIVEARWCDAEGTPVVLEERITDVWRPRADTLALDVRLTLSSAGGQLQFRGDPHHAGYQFRAANEVHKNRKKTVYLRPAGAVAKGNDIWESCAWVACLFERKGNPYAVAHFDHPDNPRPMRYSTRDYGRFGSYFEFDLEPGAPRVLRYRVLIVDRKKAAPDAAFFGARFAEFVRPAAVAVRRVE